MALFLRHTAPQRYVRIVNGNTKAATRALSSSTRLHQTNAEAWDYTQEREVLGNAGPPIRRHMVGEREEWKLYNDTRARNQEIRKHDEPSNDRPRNVRPPTPEKEKALANAASWANAKVQVNTSAGEHSWSTVFLRDLCSCPRCIDQSTRQKHFVTADIPKEIQAADLQVDAESVKIKWSNDVPGYDADHVTEIPVATLSRYANEGGVLPSHDATPRILWDAAMYEHQTQDFEYEAYMEDDTILLKALRQLQSHGLLFVTNVPGDEKSVKRLSKRIGPLKTTFYGKTWDVRSVPQAKNVAYTSQNLGFHMDLMYMKQPPHLQLLHCIRSSSAGGASTFTDSFKAAVDLCNSDLDAFDALSQIPVDYHYDHQTDYYHQSRPVIEQRRVMRNGVYLSHYSRQAHVRGRPNPRRLHIPSIDFLDAVSWSPPFQAPFGLGSGMAEHKKGEGHEFINGRVDAWHNAARTFNELIHRPEAVYERLMKPGECVIFDNRRVLHGRKEFEVDDQGKERWLRGAYIDKDPFMSKLKILNDRYGHADQVEQKSEEGDAYFEMQRDA